MIRVKVQLSMLMMIVTKIKEILLYLEEGSHTILVLWPKSLSLLGKLKTNLINNRTLQSILRNRNLIMRRKRSRDRMVRRRSKMLLRRNRRRAEMMDYRNLTSLFLVFLRWKKVLTVVFRASGGAWRKQCNGKC